MLAACSMIGFLPTTDGGRARSFFCDVLGLRLMRDDGFALVLGTGEQMIRVVRVGAFSAYPFTVLGWETPEIEGEVRGLSAAGVLFERYGHLDQDELGIWIAPGGSKIAWFKDPDGNILSLSQHAREPAG